MAAKCRSCGRTIASNARVCGFCKAPQTFSARLTSALKWLGGIATVVSIVLAVNSLVGFYGGFLEKREAVQELAAAADQLRDDGDYARAWSLYEEAREMDPGARIVRRGQEALVEAWLPNVHITGDETFTDIVNKTLPVLMRALVRSAGEKKADFQALIGWAHYLEQRERRIKDADVPGLYAKALQMNPENTYANTFLGHWYISNEENLEMGLSHFRQALNTGLYRSFVRDYQWSALSNMKRSTSTGDDEHIAVRREQLKMIHEMLVLEEPWVTGRSDNFPQEAIEAYGQPYRPRYDWFEKVWPALEPEQHLQLLRRMQAAFKPDSLLSTQAHYLLGRTLEKMNSRAEALAVYQALDEVLTANDRFRAPLDKALERLTGQLPRYALLRDDPLSFHARTLEQEAFDHPDFKLALDYFDDLVSRVYYQQELDKVARATDALSQGAERLKSLLDKPGEPSRQQDDLLDAYWQLASSMGALLLYQRSLDEAVTVYERLAQDARLRRWMHIDARYNLACALSLRSNIEAGSQQYALDRERSVASLLESIKLGYDDWNHIKRDTDLDAIRDHPEYLRIMTGR